MSRYAGKHSEKKGKPPGAVIHLGERKQEKTKITIMDYSPNKFGEQTAKKAEECFPFRESPTVTWINIDGLHETGIISALGSHFGLHPLLMEDIVNTEHRPKMEDFGDYIFIVLRMLSFDREKKTVSSEQVSLILGKKFVISFQEREGDVFEPVRERIRKDGKTIRKHGADYLAYSLIDAIVDNYFTILEEVGEHLEEIEEELVKKPNAHTLKKIHVLKREMIFLRKAVWPLREVISGMDRSESPLIRKDTHTYLKDIYDHAVQVIETIETFREMLSGMLDIYLSSVSNRMNEIMKVLTIIATIFIPLTFITGLYGMNFRYMPEIDWAHGYPAALGLMLIVALTMVLYFRKKKWL
jgi:magnesium transporter